MKKSYLTLVLLFVIAFANAQVVNFPDINFKNYLININYSDECNETIAKDNSGNNIIIDQNTDGLIQQSEADLVSELEINLINSQYIVYNIQGINQFTNLKKISLKLADSDIFPCYYSSDFANIGAFDFSGMQNLESVSITPVTHIDSPNSNINLSNCPNLKEVNVGGSEYRPSMNLNNSYNLEKLTTNCSLEDNFNFSLYPNLKVLNLAGNRIKKADLSANNQLEIVDLSYQRTSTDCCYNLPILTEIKLPQTNTLQKLILNNNRLNLINLSNYPNLSEVNINTSSLEELNIVNCPLITKLDIGNNKIKRLNINGLINLTELSCNNNLISQLDLSSASNLNILNCSNNPNLKFINVNNGRVETVFTYLPNTNLNYICADVLQVSGIQYNINLNNLYQSMFVGDNCNNSNTYVEIAIPDVNFKNKLIQLGVDQNNDSKIQLGEVLNQINLDVSNASIQSIEGIQWFSNLNTFNCSNNLITDVSQLQNLSQLTNLNCSSNTISYLNLTKLTGLVNLNFSNNSCVFIDLSKLVNLQNINASNNNLRQIYFNNNITENSIDFSGNPKLHTVTTDSNQNQYFTNSYPNVAIDNTSVFEDYYINIPDMYYYQAQKATLKSKALNLITYSVPIGSSEYLISSYDGLQEFKNLETLNALNNLTGDCNYCNGCVSQEIIDQLLNLETLYYTCGSLDINNLTTLKKLKNLRINMDNIYSSNYTLDLNGNNHLEKLNLEGGFIQFPYTTSQIRLLTNNGANEDITLKPPYSETQFYICADDFQVSTLKTQFPLANINTYCSFVPGGNYNTIQGTSVFDNELDGCDINDEVFEHLRLDLTNGTINASTFTDVLGNYKFYPNAGAFTMTPHLENPTYYTVTPTSVPVNFADNLNNVNNQYFCITPNGVHNDLEVVLAPVTPARPGFDAEYSLVFKNKGNQPLSGTVSVAFEDDKLDFVSSSLMPTSQQPSVLSWDFTNLLPFENRSITITLNTNGPMEIPAVNNGDILNFSAAITPLAGDEIPEDNSFSLKQTVVGSFDPNDIYCLEGNTVDPSKIGKYLHYNVRFENTGTFEAENIVVATTINPADYDLNSLQVLNASHNVYTRIKGNKVEFIFKNAKLKGKGGHGGVAFKMKSQNNLQANDNVTSNASIFFDYNFPVETNDATTLFTTLSKQDFIKDISVKIYPNPANEKVTIGAKNALKSITIYDAQGRIVQFVKANEQEKTIDLTQLSKGIYILDIVSEAGRMVEKLVKE